MVAIATLALVLPVASPAAASGALYPSGCSALNTNSWGDTCWLGASSQYNTGSTNVLGAQYVLWGAGFDPGIRDCEFGPTTERAVLNYQRAHGLERDGIVGTATWGSFQGQLAFSGVTDDYGNYYNVGHDGLRFYYQNRSGGAWFVLDPRHAGGQDYVAMNARAFTGFC